MSRLKDPKILLTVAAVVGLMVASRVYFPVPLPHIQLPAEQIPGWSIGPLPITNTIIAILTTDLVLVVLAILATRKMQLVPSGLQNVMEAVVEFWETQSVQMVGDKLARTYLPVVLTIFFMVWVANWSELVPGYDTVGISFVPEHTAAHAPDAHTDEAAPQAQHTMFERTGEVAGFALLGARAEESAEPGAEPVEGRAFVPFYRVASSDLNFTLALALISVVVIQVAGFRALGAGYLGKFFNVKEGPLGIFVGLLELVSELSRIISFTFRLFGNLFAGQVLLFVIPFLIPLAAVIPIYGLELFVGLIQAYVFAVLTLAFISQAVVSHDHH